MTRLNLQVFAVNTSIVDYLKSQGQDSSYSARKQLASQYGISDYNGSSSQNTALLKALQGGKSQQATASSNINAQSSNTTTNTQSNSGGKITNGNVALKGVDQGLIDTMTGKFTTSSTYQEADKYLQGLRDQINSGKTSYTDKLDNIMSQISNRDKFQYDVESDQLFQQYLSTMMKSGKTAMQDTIGQASALTGGYGSTYSVSAGNQAYNQYIQDAYANLPEYYEMAFQEYQAEGEEMYKQLAMYSDADAKEYERLYNAYGVNNDYVNTLYGQEYQKWADEVANATNLAGLQNSDYWANENFIESQRQFNKQMEYNYAQLQQEKEQFNATLNSKSGSSSESSTSEGYNASAKQKEAALEAYSKGGTKALEEYIGSQKDGMNTDALLEYVESKVIPSGTTIKKTKETMNGVLGIKGLFGGIDNNDQFLVTYPNGKTKTVTAKDLPEGVAKKINGIKKGETITW